MDIVVNVDLKDLDLNEKIGGYYDDEGDFVGGKTVAAAVIAALVTQASKGDYYKGLKERVQEIRDEEIRTRIAAQVDAAFAEPIRLTNGYGQPTGQTVTLTELVVQTAEKWLNGTERDRSTGNSVRRMDAIVRAHVEAAFKDEIAEAVKAAKESVSKQLGKSVSDVVTQAVKTALTAR